MKWTRKKHIHKENDPGVKHIESFEIKPRKMGGLFSTQKKYSLITCGLDNSGKSTIINELKPTAQRSDAIAATMGYSVEEFEKNSATFKVFDMGGARKFRDIWQHHFGQAQGIIFVIDSSERSRMCLVRDELKLMMEHPDVKGLPILFFANKMDLPGAMKPDEIAEEVGIAELCANNPTNMFASDAKRGVGIEQGLEWLQKKVAPQG